MIPFDSWGVFGKKYIESVPLAGTFALEKLEESLSKVVPAVATNTYQAAVELVLDTLGCKTSLIPVVLPINSRPGVFSAVLRSGGLPFLLDIHEETWQLDPSILREILEDLEKGAIVILNRPGGRPVHPELLEICKETPTIVDNSLCPCRMLTTDDFVGDFNLYSLEPMIGTGGVIYHQFVEQVQLMKHSRRSILNQDSLLPELLANTAERRLWHVEERNKSLEKVAEIYRDRIPARPEIEPLTFAGQAYPYFTVRVEDGERVIFKLRNRGIMCRRPFVGLHHFREVSERYQDGQVPDYSNVEKVESELIALPCHPDLLENKQAEEVVDTLLEIVNAEENQTGSEGV